MRNIKKVNSYVINNINELREFVTSQGSPIRPRFYEEFSIGKFRKGDNNSKIWRDKMGLNYIVLYKNNEIKKMLEEITREELEGKTCTEISEERKIPLSTVIKYKSCLLFIPQWTYRAGRILKAKLNFRKIEETCRLTCQERLNDLVEGCIPTKSYT